MTPVIALIDYGAGNLTSVTKALVAVGARVSVPVSPADVAGADAVVVPGVGHFAATAALDARWRDAIADAVAQGRPLLGICLGLQWLFEGSDEASGLPGFGALEGRCHLMSGGETTTAGAAQRVKVPHVGWNALAMRGRSRLLADVPDGAQAYFTHSFAAPVTADTIATTTHGETFASAVERGHVFGAQFHPEKSADVGLQLLRNFVAIVSGT